MSILAAKMLARIYQKDAVTMTRWDELPPNARVRSEIGGTSPAAPRENKYHNAKCEADGIVFDSVLEKNYYCELKMRRMAGEIKDFELQVPFILQPSFKRNGKTERAIKYIADFVVHYPDGHKQVVDTKGMRTEMFKLKRKMLLYKYPDIDFLEVFKNE